ncbi:MAG TPA: DUF6491 family protein [Hyphomonadaceae bacterium]|nr:DUF6491 family protein [Hyphomonadaceae bacterium]HPI47686.1 DUF6491 family protein [Hyphomonadaceae bacterium]
MQIASKATLAVCAATAFIAAACSSAPTQTADAKPDPRQGEQVKNICFQSQIRNWRENDRRSIIVEKGVGDEYKLDLSGTCQPDNAFLSIGLVSRVGGGSCLTSGDQLVTDARYDGPCVVNRIYKWNKDAAAPVAAN